MTAKTIVMVIVDQLAARWLEAGLDGVVPVPNLERLRASGAMFRRAFTTTPVCSPARATILTGLRTAAHGVPDTGYRLDPVIPTFPRLLRDAGWTTGAFGKLHLVPQLETHRPDYAAYGFDATAISEDARVGDWLDWVRAEHPEHYRAALATVWMTESPGVDPELEAEIRQAKAAHPEVDDVAYELPFPEEVSQTAWITDRACEFLRETPADRPLFAHIGYVQPHGPFAPPPGYLPLVDAARLPEPVPAERGGDRIPYYAQERYAAPSYETADWRRQRRLYFADLAHLDAELGRILAALDRSGRADDALVLFTADHGELLHDHGLVGKGERHYDPCIRVPLLMSGPGVEAGEHDDLVDSTDLAPTILGWAGVVPPELPVRDGEPVRGLPGRALLAGPTGRDAVYIDSSTGADPRGWARTIRTDRYRFTRHLAGGGEQLFDLVDDPDELQNLAASPEWSQVRDELADRLLEETATERHPSSTRDLFRLAAW